VRPQVTTSSPHAPNGPRRCVLLVEDEYIQARHVSILLEEMGCEVVGPVASVRAAVNLIRMELPDAALLDIKLDGPSARSLAERLDQQGIPLAVVSGYRSQDVPKTFRKFPLLGKPFTEAELKEAVQRLLDGEAQSDGVKSHAPAL
jgi:CheY-like chemotaxis protein